MLSLKLKKCSAPAGICLLLAGLAIFFVWNNLEWNERSSPFWLLTISPGHLFHSFGLGRDLLNLHFNQLLTPYSYPPLVYLVSAPFYACLGFSLPAALISQVIFILILVFSIFAIGKKLWNSWAGLLAVFITLSFPGIQCLGKYYALDLPLTAMLSLSFYLYLKSEHFENRFYSLALGAAFFLGLSTRWQMLFYLPGLLVYEAVYLTVNSSRRGVWILTFGLLIINLGFNLAGITRGLCLPFLLAINCLCLFLMLGTARKFPPPGREKNILNLALAYWVFILPALFLMHLYWPCLNNAWQDNFEIGKKGVLQGLNCAAFYFTYLNLLPGKFLLGTGYFILFVTAWFFTWFNRSARKKTGAILMILIAGYLLLSTAPVICPRFFAPLLPFIALLISGWLLELRPSYKWLLIFCALLIGFSQGAAWRFPAVFPQYSNLSCEYYLEDVCGAEDFYSVTIKDLVADKLLLLNPSLINKALFSGLITALPPCREDWQWEALVIDLGKDARQSPAKKIIFIDDQVRQKEIKNVIFPENYQNLARLSGYDNLEFKPYSCGKKNFNYLLVLSIKPVKIPELKAVKIYFLPRGIKGYLFKRIK